MKGQSERWPSCPELLSAEQVQSFKEQGFLAFNDVFNRVYAEVDGSPASCKAATVRLEEQATERGLSS